MDVIFTLLTLLILSILIVSVFVGLKMGLARYFAIRDNKREVTLFGGLVKLILWETNEGLVLQRNKAVSNVVYDSSGGTKFIYPIIGEELRARIPLNTHLVQWEDTNILTRESIQVRMKVALWWKVSDLRKYVFELIEGFTLTTIMQKLV